MRTGRYQVTFRMLSGDCGNIPSQQMDGDADLGGTMAAQGCQRIKEVLSKGSCRLDSETACDYPDGSHGRFAGYSTQVKADGSRLEGSATVTMWKGSVMCMGSYWIVWQRL